MARHYGRVTTSIWRDDDFRSLTATQQALYFMLLTQPEVTAAGTLPLTYRRWSKLSSDLNYDQVRDELATLAATGHLVIDDDTEELLIRTFVKWDGGYTNSKRLPVIGDAARGIESPILRGVLAAELDKLALSDMASALRADTASHTQSDAVSRSDRVVVTEVELDTSTRKPQSATPAPVAAATRTGLALVEQPTAQTIVGEWIERCGKRPPGTVIGQTSKSIAAMLEEGIDPDDVRRGVGAWMAKGLHPAALPSVVNEVMNSRPRPARAQQETDDMFARAAQRMGVTS